MSFLFFFFLFFFNGSTPSIRSIESLIHIDRKLSREVIVFAARNVFAPLVLK